MAVRIPELYQTQRHGARGKGTRLNDGMLFVDRVQQVEAGAGGITIRGWFLLAFALRIELAVRSLLGKVDVLIPI